MANMPTAGPGCPFCDLADRTLVWSNELAVAFADAFPVSPGHTLIVPRGHVETYFDASAWEQQALWQGVAAVKALLEARSPRPNGYNVGFNAGAAAGQTVMHLHVHVIPRYTGDMDDPRGGIRGVIPGKQKYDAPAVLAVPEDDDPFADLLSFVPGEETHLLPVIARAMHVAEEIDIAVAFAQNDHLETFWSGLNEALDRKKRVRFLTGDYFHRTHPYALQRLYTLSTRYDTLEARLYQVPKDKGSFHPKAYIFARGRHGVAFIGSSNLSHTALTDGIEWNLRTRDADRSTFEAIRARFERLFTAPQTAIIDEALVADYQAKVKLPLRFPHPFPEPPEELPTPHELQLEVLEKLRRTRLPENGGNRKGLVVMATGLGKTFLSAFDFQQFGGKRALFVAHREEILNQAEKTWKRLFPDRSIGFLMGGRKQPKADLLFASVQTLSRIKNLREFASDHFDYIVIDEFHHAAASSYRKLLRYFEPRFLLGLTATPDRMDGAELLRLCDHNLVARISLIEGITRDLLVPFRYFGVKDQLDFAPIPWRGGKFDTVALTQAVATNGRASQTLEAYNEHATQEIRRTLVFCCSVAHANFMAEYLTENGVKAAAVHSGAGSAPRRGSLDALESGELEAICAVDVFNEGVDLPDVNTILMLRPTESPIIFLQQLGRGLRKASHKTELIVVDFIGNHRSFLAKPVALVALTGRAVSPAGAIREVFTGDINKGLPEGCSVEIETGALEMLKQISKVSKEDHLVYLYFELSTRLGRRPRAAEVFEHGATLTAVKNHGTWFDFVASRDDLTEAEAEVLEEHREWFRDLTRTKMTKSFKMVVLEVMHDEGALHEGMEVARLAELCRKRVRDDVVLRVEHREHEGETAAQWVSAWRKMPLMVFHEAKSMSRQWFRVEGDRFESRLDVDEAHRETFDAMTMEIVEYRLTQHRTKNKFISNVLPLNAPIELKVSHSNSKPILRFDRKRRPDIPEGDVRVSFEGKEFVFKFVKIAVHVAVERPGGVNVLPSLMRRWYGPTAGLPGTRHLVDLVKNPDDHGWSLKKRQEFAELAAVVPIGAVPYYDELMVACGLADGQYEGHDHATSLAVKSERVGVLDAKKHFVVKASGNSMDGGAMPIRDGDLVLCEEADLTHEDQLEGRIALVTGAGVDGEVLAYLKTPVRVDGRWVLRSANPSHEDIELDPGVGLQVKAWAVEVVEERRGLELWGLYDRDVIAELFGSKNSPNWRTGHKDIDVAGPDGEVQPHSILMVNLRKPVGTELEHRYADRFLSPDEFQWESQASTRVAGKKGQRILGHAEEGRLVHLFVRYLTRSSEGTAEPYVYCGTLQTLRHENEKPIRVWFQLNSPLPDRLWLAWSRD